MSAQRQAPSGWSPVAQHPYRVGVSALAAGGVMMVIPAHLYRDKSMHDVVILGELLAVTAIALCLRSITADIGRPDRFWHLIPGLGRFHFPVSMLTWDVIVFNGYRHLDRKGHGAHHPRLRAKHAGSNR